MVDKKEITAVFGLEGNSPDYLEKKLDEVPTGGWTADAICYTGKVIVTSLELNAPNGDNATFTASFEGVGALTKGSGIVNGDDTGNSGSGGGTGNNPL
jgi:hypothetical protein